MPTTLAGRVALARGYSHDPKLDLWLHDHSPGTHGQPPEITGDVAMAMLEEMAASGAWVSLWFHVPTRLWAARVPGTDSLSRDIRHAIAEAWLAWLEARAAERRAR